MAKWFKSYRYRFKFTIDADLVDADLTDFPVALLINSAVGTGDADLTKVFDVAGARWVNLAVCGADGETPLWTEVDLWDAANETGVLHVRVPKISSSADTDLYLYFDADGLGNGYIGATGSAAGQNVWDDDFAAVYHLSQDPSGTAPQMLDSTGNERHLTTVGSMGSGDLIDSEPGKGLDFNGTSQFAENTTTGTGITTYPFTLEAAGPANVVASNTTCPGLNIVDNSASNQAVTLTIYDGYARLNFYSGTNYLKYGTVALSDGVFCHIAATGSGATDRNVFTNGGDKQQDTTNVSFPTGIDSVCVGGSTDSTPSYWPGEVSEARFSSIVRSDAWIKATYNTLSDSLGAFSAVEAISTAPDGSWLSDWQSRQKITVASGDILSSGTDVVTAIVFDGTSGASLFSVLGENSDKIAITDHTGVRQCLVDVKSWDGSGTAAELHVTVPLIDPDTDLTLYIYFDAAKADNSGFVGTTAATVSATTFSVAALGTYAGLGWLRGFTKRAKVIVDSTLSGASLDYFPVTLFLSSSCGTGSQDMTAIFDEIGANYKKLAVTAADGKTQLPVEIDYWDETGETAVLHVRVPSFDYGGDTYLYLYYSADVPDNDEHIGDVTEAPAMSVWDASFKAVYHMNQDPSAATMKDSTVSANHLTMSGTMLTADLVDSAPGKGIDFDGTDDVLYSTTVPVSDYPCTFEMKGMCEADGPCMGLADNSATNMQMLLRAVTDTDLKASFMAYNGATVTNAFGTEALTPSNNYYLAGALNSATSRSIFTDGDNKQTDTTSCAFATGLDRFSIGGTLDSTPAYYDGDVSEARVSDVARSDAWIKATYYSLADELVSYTTDAESEDAWLGDWANRIQIRIDSANFASDESDYDFIVYLGAAVGANAVNTTAIFDALGANSLKIAAADAAGVQCAVSIEDWDETAETAILHVTVPTIFAARDTLIYLYYDVAKADNSGYVDELGAGASQDDDWANIGATETLGGSWLRGWKYRRAFTVPSTNIDGDLNDFPLALILNTSAGTGDADVSSIFDELGENSKRIAVTTAHGDKQVPVEIDMWDGAGESAVLHAKVPFISAADGAVLYVYYDDDRYDDGFIGETGDAIAQRVWDANFFGVYHLSQDPSGSAPQIKDSTSNANHMTSGGTMTTGDLVDSAPGKGIDFDGSNDSLRKDSPAGLPTSAFTLEAAGPGTDTGITCPAIQFTDASAANDFCSIYLDGGYAKCNQDGTGIFSGTQAISAGVFTYVALSQTTTSNRDLFTNGGNKTNNADSWTFPAGLDRMCIGNLGDSSPYYFAGVTSEARFSDIARSAAWLKATYYTLFDDIAAWGAEGAEPTGGEPTTIDEPLSKAGRIDFTPHSLTEVLSMTEALSKAGRIDFTPHSLSESYTGNLLKMVDASGSRPKILTATGTKAQISAAAGARPRLAAAEAYEYQERE